MKLEKILHYVEKSYFRRPSFILLMSDGKEYISNGCQFVENTDENREILIEEYDCERHLLDLLAADSIEMKDVTNARCMFWGSDITEFKEDMSSVKNSRDMFCCCAFLTEFSADMSSVTDDTDMFWGCESLKDKDLIR